MKTKFTIGLTVFTILLYMNSLTLLAQNGRQSHPKEYSGARATEIIPGAEYVKGGVGTQFPTFVRFDEKSRISYPEFFSWLKRTVKYNQDIDFKLKLSKDDEKTGITHHRYIQTFKGIPIEQGEYIVHVKNNRVLYFNGLAFDIPSGVQVSPVITENDALDIAKNEIGAIQYKWESEYWENRIKERTNDPNATYFPKGQLVINVSDFKMANVTPKFQLAYRFDISAATPDGEKRIYIDAVSGDVQNTLRMESDCETASVTTIWNGARTIYTNDTYIPIIWPWHNYYLKDNCQSAVIEVRDWGSTNCTSSPNNITNTTNTWNNNNNEQFGGSVLWAAKRSYAYWKNVQSRNSYDNSNGDIDGYINAVFSSCGSCLCPYTDNASMSFSGGTMKVGLGSSGTLTNSWGSLDIIGHEYAHAVTGAGDAAQLVYQNESGALNESFSDIFGEMVERYVNGSCDYLMGDDRDDGYIRNMSDPNDKNDPDTYSGTNWFTGTGDNGGVHTNSGVQNFWFYLLANGGSGTNDNGDSYTVSGVGEDVAAWIAQNNLLAQLSSNSDYSDARAGAIQSAIDGYGACSNVVKQVTNAWHAVGVGDPFLSATAAVTSNFKGRDISCFGYCDGSAAVSVVGGVSPTYSWSNGASSQSISGLCAGTYTVTVTSGGCSVTKSVTLSNPPQLAFASLTTSNYNGYNISCFGGSDGSATAYASGGTAPYTYLWSNGAVTHTASGLSAGTYTVSINDGNGCRVNGSVTLTEPPVVTISAAPTSFYGGGYNIRCFGNNDGEATAYPSGGVGGFTYNWSNGSTSNPATALYAGTYTVTVTDDNGCSANASTTLTEPPQLTIDAGQNEIVYYGYPDSACTDLVSSGSGGGVPPYSLNWSTGSSSSSINVCPPTSTVYYLTISDANGCSVTDSAKVCAFDVRCGNNLNNVILCHATGSPNNPFVTVCVSLAAAQAHFLHHSGDQLAACGTVKVCEFAAPVPKINGGPEDAEVSFLEVYPNPFSDLATVRFRVRGDGAANIRVMDITGKQLLQLYEGDIYGGNMYELNFDGSVYAEGMYFISMQTSSGERIMKKIIMNK